VRYLGVVGVLAIALLAASAASADLLISAPAERVCAGRGSITLGVYSRPWEGGSGKYTVRLIDPVGRVVFSRAGSAPTTWTYWAYHPRRLGVYQTIYSPNKPWSRFKTRDVQCSASPTSSVSPSSGSTYKNCTSLNRVYPHGVGRLGARDHTSGTGERVHRRRSRPIRPKGGSLAYRSETTDLGGCGSCSASRAVRCLVFPPGGSAKKGNMIGSRRQEGRRS
jgi:hypothetical protein